MLCQALGRAGAWGMDQWLKASFLQGAWSLISPFPLCHSSLPLLLVMKFEFSLNPHSELT